MCPLVQFLNQCIFFCLVWKQELYVLMRLHQVLCERLGKAVRLAEEAKALKAVQVRGKSHCCRLILYFEVYIVETTLLARAMNRQDFTSIHD